MYTVDISNKICRNNRMIQRPDKYMIMLRGKVNEKGFKILSTRMKRKLMCVLGKQ